MCIHNLYTTWDDEQILRQLLQHESIWLFLRTGCQLLAVYIYIVLKFVHPWLGQMLSIIDCVV